MSNNKATILLTFARSNDGKLTTKQANTLLARFYYCNAEHYVSEVLKRLVDSRALIRVSRGNYEVNPNYRPGRKGVHPVNIQQPTLF